MQQMCLESEERLVTDSNPIFRPIDVDDSAKPLEGCVLCVRYMPVFFIPFFFFFFFSSLSGHCRSVKGYFFLSE